MATLLPVMITVSQSLPAATRPTDECDSSCKIKSFFTTYKTPMAVFGIFFKTFHGDASLYPVEGAADAPHPYPL